MQRSLGLKDVHVYLRPAQYDYLAGKAMKERTTISQLTRDLIEIARQRDARKRRRQAKAKRPSQ